MRERLDRLRGSLAGDQLPRQPLVPAGRPPTTTTSRRRVEALASVIPISIIENPDGCFGIHERHYSTEELASGWSLGDPVLGGLQMWAGIRDAEPVEYAFVDLETTGLDRGPGTYAFLVGIGRFVREGFTVRQFFLADPSGERAMLLAVREELRSAAVVVTFNGRSFDVPHLYNRFAMNRVRPPNFEPHFDALPPARRIWQRRLISCSLQSLEQGLFKVDREGDIPGWLIPEVYFHYLHHGEINRLPNVLHHNATDIVSLAALSTVLARIGRGWSHAEVTAPEDGLSAGIAYARAGRIEEALRCYRFATEIGHTETRCQALSLTAQILRRQKRIEEAKEVLRHLSEEPGYHALHALIDLAKISEHRERNFKRALDHSNSAVTKLEMAFLTEDRAYQARIGNDLRRRISRLHRKMAKQESSTAPAELAG